jgi:hypothetical protein
LNRASVVVPETAALKDGKIEIHLTPNALVLLEIEK